MSSGRVILNPAKFEITLIRLVHQLIENYDDFENTCIIGIQERGVLLADRLIQILTKEKPNLNVAYGKLDITFYRDDFRIRETPIKASETNIDFSLDKMRVILVDDVLYTGRTIHAAMSALLDFGRPEEIRLLTMVDRRFNRHLPIGPDFSGLAVDAVDQAYVRVHWKETEQKDQILLFPAKESQ